MFSKWKEFVLYIITQGYKMSYKITDAASIVIGILLASWLVDNPYQLQGWLEGIFWFVLPSVVVHFVAFGLYCWRTKES